MPVRIGVDVGGTFTKAVACDASGDILFRSVVPTTHTAALGVAEGVVGAVAAVAGEARASGAGSVALVAHSTTQAVNSLLEGDTGVVGILGIGRKPDLRRAHRRTRVGDVRLAPGRDLRTIHGFLDGTGGVTRRAVEDAMVDLVARGAQAVCVSEAFGVDDAKGERLALEVAAELGVPACAGHELSGLYGLQTRTVTAAINASIVPAGLRTAEAVEAAAAREAVGAPLLVMRGDGGAASMQAMRRHPLLTAFSGPAASVTGALRHVAVRDGIVVEVGGTSTNVCAIKGGRPVLAYVRVLEHVTCVRSLDVRVVGVAGGSLLRLGRHLRRARVEDVGPRSAHIAGLPYCCFAEPEELADARALLTAPREGDPESYAIVEAGSGRRFALTLTCAANALGEVAPGSYAAANQSAARRGFEALGQLMEADWRTAARRALELATSKVSAIVREAAADNDLRAPAIVGLGGGAGALLPELARVAGLPATIPRDAEIISSVGDALSLVRVEQEHALPSSGGASISEMHRRAEIAAVAAGAAASSVQVESCAVPERGALRVVAVGSVALEARDESEQADTLVDDGAMQETAFHSLGCDATLVARNDFYAVFSAGVNGSSRFAIVDRHATLAHSGEGHVVMGTGTEVVAALERQLPKMARRFGPVVVAPALRLLRGARLVDLTLLSSPDRALEAARAECACANGDQVVAFLSRS